MTSMAWLLALVSAASAQEVDYTTEPLDKIKAKVESKKAVLADVRELREWDKGHLKNAVFLPLSKLSEWERDGISDSEKAKLAKSLPKGSVVYCHCAAGGRALPGAEALKKLGYDARPLKTGYRDLIEAGFVQEPKK
jgi:rhodanese-related sulfurtransferase